MKNHPQDHENKRCSEPLPRARRGIMASRRAVTLVYVTITLPVLVGMGALAVDVGYICNLAAESQNLADSAALAGASALAGQDRELAYARALEIIERFQKSYRYMSTRDQIIEIGSWNLRTLTFQATGDLRRANAVRVVAVRRDVPMFFAAFFGKPHVTVKRQAIASAARGCRGIWGLENVTVPGNPSTDSFISTDGPYSELDARPHGDICSGGPLTISGSVYVDGNALAAPGELILERGSNLEVTGEISYWTGTLVPPEPDFEAVRFNNDNDTIGPTAMNRNALRGNGELYIATGDNLTLEPGTYYFSAVTFGQPKKKEPRGTLTITGPTNIYVTGDFNLEGSGELISTHPADFTLYSAGSNVKIAGGVNFYGSIVAPNAEVELLGDAQYFGGAIGKTVKMSGNFQFHVDESLEVLDLVTVPGAVMLVK